MVELELECSICVELLTPVYQVEKEVLLGHALGE